MSFQQANGYADIAVAAVSSNGSSAPVHSFMATDAATVCNEHDAATVVAGAAASSSATVGTWPVHIAHAIPAVAQLVQKLRQCVLHEKDASVAYELEARFGQCTFQPNRFGVPVPHFVSGVSVDTMGRIMRDLASFQHWFRVVDFSEMQDFVYPVHQLGSVRTSVHYDDKTSGTVQRRHIIKERVDSVIVRLVLPEQAAVDAAISPDSGLSVPGRTLVSAPWCGTANNSNTTMLKNAGNNAAAQHYFDMRIDLNREKEIPQDDPRLPHLINTTHMRIKQRKSYMYASKGALQPTWQFDVTLSWSGKTKTEAEAKQQSEPPVCEVECELLNPRHVLIENGKDDQYVAASLLCKMSDFVDHKYAPYMWTVVQRS